MVTTLFNEVLDRSASGGNKEGLPSDTVIISDLLATIGRNLLQPRPWLREGVARVLSVVPVVAADAVGRVEVAAVSEVDLDGLFGRAMSFLAHDAFFAVDGVLFVGSADATTRRHLPDSTAKIIKEPHFERRRAASLTWLSGDLGRETGLVDGGPEGGSSGRKSLWA